MRRSKPARNPQSRGGDSNAAALFNSSIYMDNAITALLQLQRRYDELQADCKDLLNVVVNLSQGKEEPVMVDFNDSNGYPSIVLDLIRRHATWSKEPINKE